MYRPLGNTGQRIQLEGVPDDSRCDLSTEENAEGADRRGGEHSDDGECHREFPVQSVSQYYTEKEKQHQYMTIKWENTQQHLIMVDWKPFKKCLKSMEVIAIFNYK